MRIRVFGALCLLFSGAAFAAKPDVPTGFYLGAGLGRATVKLETPDLHNDFEGDGGSKRAIVGYRFLPWVAAEAAYDDFGTAEDEVGERFLRVDVQTKFHALSAGAVGMLPLGPVDLKLKVGVTSWKGWLRSTLNGYRENVDNVDMSMGFGVQYRFKQFALRSDWDAYLLGFDDDGDDDKDFDDSIGNWSLGLTWTF